MWPPRFSANSNWIPNATGAGVDIFWLVCLFVAGACLGRLANIAIYSIRVPPRPPDMPPRSRPLSSRRPADWIPIVGWFFRARDSGPGPAGAWKRPLVVELFAAAGVAALYWWEVEQKGLLPPVGLGRMLFPGFMPHPDGIWVHGDFPRVLHVLFATHVALVMLMLVASLIDIDEMIIPDEVTVPGALAALAAAAIFPWVLLPGMTWPGPGRGVSFLTLTFPCNWPPVLDGAPQVTSLAIGLACYWAWCVALLPWLWRPGLGYGRAARMLLAYVPRRVSPLIWIVMPLAGGLVIAGVWFAGGARWAGLLTALVGLAAGGGLVWIVRVLGGAILGREAMGFGDVTLMAMIGALLGWQAVLVVFFLAPLAALLVGLLQWIIHRDNVLPYGPYLCLAAVAVIVGWVPVWERIAQILQVGPLVPLALLLCLPLMAVLFFLVRVVKSLFQPRNAS